MTSHSAPERQVPDCIRKQHNTSGGSLRRCGGSQQRVSWLTAGSIWLVRRCRRGTRDSRCKAPRPMALTSRDC
jgi:hypothetical protein